MSAVQHEHYTPSPKTKQYESRNRLAWAAHFPLLPGRDIMSRRGLLVLIADTAISGSFYESQQKLAERAGISIWGVQKLLAKLCAEGALRAHRRGFKKTTRYTLLRLAEVAEHGAFLPPGEASSGPLDPYSSTAQTPHPPHLTRTTVRLKPKLTRTTVRPKEDILHEEKKTPPTPPLVIPAPKLGTISPTARRLHDYIVQRTSRPLPEAWVFYPTLKQELDRRDFLEVGSVLAGILDRSGGTLPKPGEFFKTYEKPKSNSKRKPNRNRRRRAA